MKRDDRHWVEKLAELTTQHNTYDHIIDLSVGQPDGTPPSAVSESLARLGSDFNTYPPSRGSRALRTAISDWVSNRYELVFGPDEILVTHGAKLAVALAPLAFTSPGDTVVAPTPGYPTYSAACRQLDRRVRWLELNPETRYEPSAGELEAAFDQAEMAYLSYPSNPTGVAGSERLFRDAIAVAEATKTILVHDAAYAELRHDGRRLSIFKVPGADEVAVELHSLSKSFHLAGYRIGFAVARPPLLTRLAQVVGAMDTGAARISQYLAEVALRSEPDFSSQRAERDQRRTTAMARGLSALGCDVIEPDSSFYVWFRPSATQLDAGRGWEAVVRHAGIACAPGSAFGPRGDGWIRFSCATNERRFKEVFERLERLWN